jgi:rare lipoprotein A (peptidoglycan hydrolase)
VQLGCGGGRGPVGNERRLEVSMEGLEEVGTRKEGMGMVGVSVVAFCLLFSSPGA